MRSLVADTIDTVPGYSYLKEQKVLGRTGHGVAFSEEGDREKSIYEVVNTQGNSFKVIGHYGGQQVRCRR